MIAMIHDKASNNFYIVQAGLMMIKGLEHGDIDAMIFVKGLLKQVKPVDLTARLPNVYIHKLYQTDLSLVDEGVISDKSLDPEPWEIPTTIR